ncbi:transposable element Tcb2 transposase [Trichonephila clavipes]|uniref:Transposable element Tcb2 transposase n=1 Tax=Trichonephila clavipes TaxID=2585209 RepID=A0A8X6R132_TRICX|nr:transposable element Tcb2 transposase [Trichonephila clavipes]
MPFHRFRRQYGQMSQFERGRIIGMMEAGWLARRVARQLGTSDCVSTHRRLRLEWYRARGNWTAAEWNQVVFSDKSRFNLSSDDNRVRVWVPCGERLNPAFALQRHTATTAGVMVWGAIAYNSRSPLVLIRGTMTARWYVHDILQPLVLLLMQRLPGAIFNKTMFGLTRKGSHKTVSAQLLSFLSLPDPQICLSQFVWDHLGRRAGHPTSLNELQARLQQVRNEMSQDIIQNLYASMPDRIALCINARGGSTGYKLSQIIILFFFLVLTISQQHTRANGVTENISPPPAKTGFGCLAGSYKGYVLSVSQALSPLEPWVPRNAGVAGVYVTPLTRAHLFHLVMPQKTFSAKKRCKNSIQYNKTTE